LSSPGVGVSNPGRERRSGLGGVSNGIGATKVLPLESPDRRGGVCGAGVSRRSSESAEFVGVAPVPSPAELESKIWEDCVGADVAHTVVDSSASAQRSSRARLLTRSGMASNSATGWPRKWCWSRASPSSLVTSSFRMPSMVMALIRSASCASMASRSKGSSTTSGPRNDASFKTSSVPMLRIRSRCALRIWTQYFASPWWRCHKRSAALVTTTSEPVDALSRMDGNAGESVRALGAFLVSTSFSDEHARCQDLRRGGVQGAGPTSSSVIKILQSAKPSPRGFICHCFGPPSPTAQSVVQEVAR